MCAYDVLIVVLCAYCVFRLLCVFIVFCCSCVYTLFVCLNGVFRCCCLFFGVFIFLRRVFVYSPLTVLAVLV